MWNPLSMLTSAPEEKKNPHGNHMRKSGIYTSRFASHKAKAGARKAHERARSKKYYT